MYICSVISVDRAVPIYKLTAMPTPPAAFVMATLSRNWPTNNSKKVSHNRVKYDMTETDELVEARRMIEI
jgi:hypothetical protein